MNYRQDLKKPAVVEVQDNVRGELDRYKTTEMIGIANIFKTIYDLDSAYKRLDGDRHLHQSA